MGLIVGSSVPQKITRAIGIDPSPVFFGMPGMLTVLPEGGNVLYLETDDKLFNIDDSKVDMYVLEIWLPVESNPRFQKWLSGIDKGKVVMGGAMVTANPQQFLQYASKLVVGKCDELFETIRQDGTIVNGISLDRKLPRYDLFDINALSIKYNIDKVHPPKRGYGLLTSDGCRNNCDFCIMSSPRYRGFYHKPLDYLEEEVGKMVKTYGAQPFAFIYDSNFCQADQWQERLEIISSNKLATYYGAYLSANSIKPGTIEFLANHGMKDIFIGLEDVNRHFHKNDSIIEVAREINSKGMGIILSSILNPADLIDKRDEVETYTKLLDFIKKICPAKVEIYFLKYIEGSLLAEKMKRLCGFDINDYNQYMNRASNDPFDVTTLEPYWRVNYIVKDDQRTREIIKAQYYLRQQAQQFLRSNYR